MPSVTVFNNNPGDLVAPEPSMPAEEPGPQPVGPMMSQSFRRSGMRPLSVEAALVAYESGANSPCPFWYELNIYLTSSQTFIADIRLFRKGAEEFDQFWVQHFDTLEECIQCFENHDARQFVVASLPVDEDSLSLAELTLLGINLRRDMVAAERQYKALVSQLLDCVTA